MHIGLVGLVLRKYLLIAARKLFANMVDHRRHTDLEHDHAVQTRHFTNQGLHPSSGFTLIELLVVVVILGLLISILLPTLRKVRELTRRTVCANNVKQQSLAFMMYNDDYGFLPHSVRNGNLTIAPTGWIGISGLLTMDGNQAQALEGYGLTSLDHWTCPSVDTGAAPRGYVRDTSGAAFLPFMFHADHYAIYTYLDGVFWPAAHPLRNGALSATHVNLNATHAMVGDGTYNFQDFHFSANHVSYGRGFRFVEGWNTGYGDGHVNWITKSAAEQKGLFYRSNAQYASTWFPFFW